MDGDVVIFSEKLLQRLLRILRKRMTGFLVQRMSSYLCQSRTITDFEAQIVKSQATDMQKASKLMEVVIKKGRSACSSFLSCLGICDPKLYESVTGYPVPFSQEDHQHLENITFSEEPTSFPTCIINIHNSSLQHCIIGSNNHQCITCNQHSSLSENDAMNVDEMEDSHDQLVDEIEDSHDQLVDEIEDSHDQQIPAHETGSNNGIHMESSHIKYVIIGNHNSMTVTETLDSEVEEDTEIEPDVNG